MTRFLNANDFLRIHTCDAINEGEAHLRGISVNPALSKAERYEQVRQAKQLRNFWFTSTLASRGRQGNLLELGPLEMCASVTPRFSEPVILTDILSLWEPPLETEAVPSVVDGYAHFLLASIAQIGGEGNAYGLNFFNTSVPVVSWLTLKHERNRQAIAIGALPSVPELMDKSIAFTPHLLRPWESLQATFWIDGGFISSALFPHCGFRGVRVLAADSPYAQLSALADQQVRNYIDGAEPETFFMEVRTTLASLGALSSGFVDLRTPQQDRPLLILGAASNVEGCQMRVMEEASYYQFTYQDKPNLQQFSAGGFYTDPPLQLMAPNTDFRNTNLFNTWPVPHVLEPGAQLRIRLNNGLFPKLTDGQLRQAAATRDSQDVRITFLCRTV